MHMHAHAHAHARTELVRRSSHAGIPGIVSFPISELFSPFLYLSLVTRGDGVIYSLHSVVITSRTSFVLSLLVGGGKPHQGMR